jgi:hypothetical protein
MILYHGTAERHLPTILKHGLTPRGKAKGNWKHSVLSHPDAVYLTRAYGLHYAHMATDAHKDDDRLVVLEIDTAKLDPWLLAPDEDWLEQVTRKDNAKHLAPINRTMKYRTRWYRRNLMKFASHWSSSLDGIGNCTYHGTVPPGAIARIAFVAKPAFYDLVMAGYDPMISVANYRHVGGRYRNAMKRLFGAAVEDEEEDLFARLKTPEENAAYKAHLDTLWSTGIEVRGMPQ